MLGTFPAKPQPDIRLKSFSTQRLQNPLIKEYALKIYKVYSLMRGVLESLGSSGRLENLDAPCIEHV